MCHVGGGAGSNRVDHAHHRLLVDLGKQTLNQAVGEVAWTRRTGRERDKRTSLTNTDKAGLVEKSGSCAQFLRVGLEVCKTHDATIRATNV